MDLPEDCELTYIVNHEAWYAEAAGTVREPSIGVHASSNGGGVAWEFVIVGHPKINGGAVQVCMFDDAFDAWEQVPELFTALREVVPHALDAVCDLLDDLGAKDRTQRTSPYPPKSTLTRREAVVRVLGDDLLTDKVLASLNDADA